MKLRPEPLCEVVDRSVEYVNEDGFLPHLPGEVYSVDALRDHLRAASNRAPHIVHLNLRDGLRVVVAIGGPLGAIRLERLSVDQNPGGRTFAS